MLVDVTFLAPKRPVKTNSTSKSVHLFVPKNLVQQEGDSTFVWVADQSGRVARKTSVQTGSRGSRNLIEITSGLTDTSKLISTPIDDLRNGARIHVIGEDPTPVDATPPATNP